MLKSSPKPLDPTAQKKSASTPHPAQTRAEIKSLIRKNLLASPEFPRLYADAVLHYFPNSNEARILAPHYKKIIAWVEAEKARVEKTKAEKTKVETTTLEPTKLETSKEKSTMSKPLTSKDCAHIKVTGVRCGSPALRGEQFCYFHQRMIRTVRVPPQSRVHHAALLEDEESIQASLMEVVNSLLRGTIEVRRAELILRALNTAVRNSRRVKFGLSKEMVTQIPEYAIPADTSPEAEAELAARARAEVAARAERLEYDRAESARIRAEHEAPKPPDSCGDGRLARPAAQPHSVSPSPALPQRLPHPEPALSEVEGRLSKGGTTPDPTHRKPPLSVPQTPAPKERKIAAHRASGG